MSQSIFMQHAAESVLFAIFLAETRGICHTQIDLWLRALAARSIH